MMPINWDEPGMQEKLRGKKIIAANGYFKKWPEWFRYVIFERIEGTEVIGQSFLVYTNTPKEATWELNRQWYFYEYSTMDKILDLLDKRKKA